MKGPWTPQVEYISGSWTIFMLVLDLSCSDVLLRLVWGPETFDKSYKHVMCWFWFCCLKHSQKTSLKISRWFTATDADTQSWTVVSGLTVNVVGLSPARTHLWSFWFHSPLMSWTSWRTDGRLHSVPSIKDERKREGERKRRREGGEEVWTRWRTREKKKQQLTCKHKPL